MNRLPQITPVSTLRHNHLEVLAQLKDGPVVLASRSRPVGVLVSPAQWDVLAARLDDLEATNAALLAELALASGEEHVDDIDLDALKAQASHETVASSMD